MVDRSAWYKKINTEGAVMLTNASENDQGQHTQSISSSMCEICNSRYVELKASQTCASQYVPIQFSECHVLPF